MKAISRDFEMAAISNCVLLPMRNRSETMIPHSEHQRESLEQEYFQRASSTGLPQDCSRQGDQAIQNRTEKEIDAIANIPPHADLMPFCSVSQDLFVHVC